MFLKIGRNLALNCEKKSFQMELHFVALKSQNKRNQDE